MSTDFADQYLGVVQVSGLNSSTDLRVVDLAESDVNLTVVVSVVDDPPHSDDRVITTLLVRLDRPGTGPPDRIWVELSVGGRQVTFSGTETDG